MEADFGVQKRYTRDRQGTTSVVCDACGVSPYSVLVRKQDDSPSDSPVHAWDWMYQRYSAGTVLGRELRRGVAEMWLRDLANAEADVRERAALNAQITDRIERLKAESSLRMECLVRFGATLDEFDVFRRVLAEVVIRGHLTIGEAAVRTHWLVQRNGGSSVGGAAPGDSGPSRPRRGG